MTDPGALNAKAKYAATARNANATIAPAIVWLRAAPMPTAVLIAPSVILNRPEPRVRLVKCTAALKITRWPALCAGHRIAYRQLLRKSLSSRETSNSKRR